MQIDDILKDGAPFIIDGGLSNVLEEQGCDLNQQLWTAKILENEPEAIIQAHLDYLKSGAQCITTSSYQASVPGLIAIGYAEESAEKVILKSVQLAEIAINRALDSGIIDFRPLIAASVGPYGAYLADGSEYRGNYDVSDETLGEFHLERLRILDRSKADILACETIPDFQEARVLAEMLEHVDKPSWISFSCRDEQHLNDGSKIEKCVSLFKNHPKVFAVGVNCTDPEYISGIITRIKSSGVDKRIIVYPNSGEAYNAKSKTWVGVAEPKLFVEMTKEWSKLGADIIGGCCRIGPEHIRRMSKVIVKGNNEC
jgi:homocysteine S-methyltransferase